MKFKPEDHLIRPTAGTSISLNVSDANRRVQQCARTPSDTAFEHKNQKSSRLSRIPSLTTSMQANLRGLLRTVFHKNKMYLKLLRYILPRGLNILVI